MSNDDLFNKYGLAGSSIYNDLTKNKSIFGDVLGTKNPFDISKNILNDPLSMHRFKSEAVQEEKKDMTQEELIKIIIETSEEGKTELELESNGLRNLPAEIGSLRLIEKLDLSENKLQTLPDEFNKLENLSVLILSENQFRDFPEVIFKLNNLEEIIINNNRLRELPAGINGLKKLLKIDLSNNNLRDLPDDIKLTKIQELLLSDNQFRELPISICELRELSLLDISNNELRSLPKEIGSLRSLQEFLISSNEISYLPQEIIYLSSLQQLDVSDNELIELVDEIGLLENLTKLSIKNNMLELLPESVGQLLSLRKLVVSGNKLNELPSELVNCEFLEELEVEDNPLESPPNDVIENGLHAIKFYFLSKAVRFFDTKYKRYSFNFPKEIKTAFKQYLSYFNEFVHIAKGKNIGFEVRSTKKGIEIGVKTENESEIKEIGDYFEEYIKFIEQNIDELRVDIDADITNAEKDILIVELKNQVRNFQTAIEIRDVKLRLLQDEMKNLRQIMLNYSNNPTPIALDISVGVEIQQTIDQVHPEHLPKIFDAFQNELTKNKEQYLQNLAELNDSLEFIKRQIDTSKPNMFGIKENLKTISDLMGGTAASILGNIITAGVL